MTATVEFDIAKILAGEFGDSMPTINFWQNFVNDPSRGRDYSLPVNGMPPPMVINVPKEGITDNERIEFDKKMSNIINAHLAAQKYLQAQEANANTHAQGAKTQKATIKAATEWQGVREEFATHQSAVMSADYAELKVSVDREKYQVQGETLFVELAHAKLDHGRAVLDWLQTAHDLRTHRIVTSLNGVDVSQVPEITKDEYQQQLMAALPPVDFNCEIDLADFLKKTQQQTQAA